MKFYPTFYSYFFSYLCYCKHSESITIIYRWFFFVKISAVFEIQQLTSDSFIKWFLALLVPFLYFRDNIIKYLRIFATKSTRIDHIILVFICFRPYNSQYYLSRWSLVVLLLVLYQGDHIFEKLNSLSFP